MKKILLSIAVIAIVQTLDAQNWVVTGNGGLTSANFLGTTDAVPLTFKTNNQRSGYLDYASGKANTAFGYQSLNVVTGTNNVAIGYKASALNTSGRYNTSAGAYALSNTTTGYSNVAIGIGALYRNNSANNLVGVGDSALYNARRTAFGGTPTANTAVGSKAAYSLEGGSYNTVVGFQALYTNTAGHDNTAIGWQALYSDNGCTGCNTGAYNTATGIHSLYATTSGYGNTGNGCWTLVNNTTGTWNSAFGYDADVNSGGYLFSTALGAFSLITASNQVRIGDGSTTSIGGYANWTNISDVRVKKNIKQNVPGLAFINKLHPITYNLDLEAAERLTQPAAITNREGQQMQVTKEALEVRRAKEQVIYTGFSAQEVEKAAKELNFDFSGVDAAKNSKDLYGLRYSDFVVPLVKAVQELSKINDEKNIRISNLEKQNKELALRLEKIEKQLGQSITLNTNAPK